MVKAKKTGRLMLDHRRTRRNTKVLPVDLTILAFPPNRLARHPLYPGDSFGGRTINLSRSGLQVHSDYELDPKTLVWIEFSLVKGGQRIRLTAQVAWAKRNAYDLYGRWAMGMHFIQSEEEKAKLKALGTFFHRAI